MSVENSGSLDLFIPVLPASVNSMYQRNRNGGVRLSSQAVVFNQCAIPMLRLAKNRAGVPIFKTKVVVELWFSWPTKQRHDCDNRLKSCFDAIQKAGVVQDDCLLLPWVRDFKVDPSNPGVKLRIYEHQATGDF